jgi:hypothetical protein
LKVRLEV